MSPKENAFVPDSPAAAARVVAMLVARDGRIDWREIDFLDRSGAFTLLGVTRSAFLGILAQALGERAGSRAAHAHPFAPELQAIRTRRLQLLVAGLLVHIAEIDREVGREESALVRQAFASWNLSPETLRKEMRIPLNRSRAALGLLPEAA